MIPAASPMILFQSACVVASFVDAEQHLIIQAKPADIDETSVDQLFKITEALMQEKDAFQTTWDLIECRNPSIKITSKCIRWAMSHRKLLNSKNSRLAVVSKSRPINAVVSLVLKTFGPSCPTLVTSEKSEAVNFMHASSS